MTASWFIGEADITLRMNLQIEKRRFSDTYVLYHKSDGLSIAKKNLLGWEKNGEKANGERCLAKKCGMNVGFAERTCKAAVFVLY